MTPTRVRIPHIKEMEILDPYPLLYGIWEVPTIEGFKPTSLVKFNRCNDPYEYVASINNIWTLLERLIPLSENFYQESLRMHPCDGIWVYHELSFPFIKNQGKNSYISFSATVIKKFHH